MARTIYLSVDGDDANDGSKDAPVASLEKARDIARKLPRAPGGITILINDGLYERARTLELGRKDSGTPSCPVVYRAVSGGKVRISGGRLIRNLKRVTDASVLKRLDPAARKHVLESDLSEAGVRNAGSIKSRGFGRAAATSHMELFLDGRRMTLARWPNSGEDARIAGVPEKTAQPDGHGGKTGDLKQGFFYEGDRPLRWKERDEIWIHGYWAWDWANTYERVASIDTRRRFIKTAAPFGMYGFRTGQRIYFLNILEELDAPGEWYVDRKARKLYFWPPGKIDSKELMVSVLEEPLVRMKDVSHVTFEGLSFEATRSDAIVIEGGRGNSIKECAVKLTGNYGVKIEGGFEHAVEGCQIHDNGDGGVTLTGGDRTTLKPGNHVVRNCHLYRQAQWSKCYYPAIHMTGVGLRAEHNLIHDHPHCPVLFWGNDHRIEFNEIHHVCLETGDVGAIYIGRDWTFRGNLVKHNFVHHTGGVGMGSMGVYLDDCVSTVDIIGNVFYKVQRAAFIGGGRDNLVENNMFIDCMPAVELDGRGVSNSKVWHDMVYATLKERLFDVPKALYCKRYPRLASVFPYYRKDNGVPPEGNVARNNICSGGIWANVHWGATPDMLAMQNNLVSSDPHFVDSKKMNFQLKKTSPAYKLGFKKIPFEKIGLLRKT